MSQRELLLHSVHLNRVGDESVKLKQTGYPRNKKSIKETWNKIDFSFIILWN